MMIKCAAKLFSFHRQVGTAVWLGQKGNRTWAATESCKQFLQLDFKYFEFAANAYADFIRTSIAIFAA